MKAKSILRLFSIVFLPVLLLFVHAGVSAQPFHFTTRGEPEIRRAYQIGNHGFEDTIIARSSYWSYILANGISNNNLKFKSVQALLSMHIDHAHPKKVADPYVYRLTYVLTGYPDGDTANHFVDYADTLTISYHPDSLTAYQDIQMKRYSSFHKVRVRLTGLYDFTNPASVVPVPLNTIKERNFSVEATILTQPYDKNYYGSTPSTPNALLVAASHNAANDYVEVRWNLPGQPFNSVPNLTPVSYELEWAYADNYNRAPDAAITDRNTSQVTYDFDHNSTRLWLDTNYFRIPAVYQRGYLVYRVRMVRPDSIQYRYPVYGEWSIVNPSGTISSLSATSQYLNIATTHMDNKLNWQYTISFAEQGKYKHVMNYFDGLLKNRQSITRINSNPGQLIATEQVYDYEGRPAIQLLPTPVNSTAFRYQAGMSLNAITNTPYKAADFDTIRRYSCPGEAVPSPLAPNALASIYYSPLNPDTARFQKFVPDAGGYPFVQTIYSAGHDGRVELQGGAGDTLQIGRGHVTTNEYVSADQQELNRLFGVDAGYAGFYRKTVTTDPNGQVSLSVQDFQGRQVISSLIGRGGNPLIHAVQPGDVPDSAYFQEDLLANTPQQTVGNKRIADKSFYMDVKGLDTLQYVFEFAPYAVCLSPASYLSVKAGYELHVNDNCGTEVYRDGGTLGYTGVLNSPQVVPYPTAKVPLWLEKGKHSVHKELTVNLEDIYAAVDSFMYKPANACVMTEPAFIRNAVESTNFPCPDEDDPCAANKKRMMEELWPTRVVPVNGCIRKYGYYDIDNIGNVYGNTNSIFTIMGGDLGDSYYRYQDPCIVVLPQQISWMGMTYTDLANIPVDTFIKIFNDEIAEALLPLHPEYCKLKACFVDTFKDRMMAIPDGKTAASLGLLRIDDIVTADPLYPVLNTALGGNFRDSLSTFKGGRVYLDTMAIIMAYCECADSTMFRQCYQRIFRDPILLGSLINDQVKDSYFKHALPFYFANRERFKNALLSAPDVQDCEPCKKPIRMDLMPRPVFPTYYTANGQLDTSSESSFFNLYGSSLSVDWDFFKRLAGLHSGDYTPDSLAVLADSANALQPRMMMALCVATVDSMIAQLGNCLPQANLVNVRAHLLGFCGAFANGGGFTPELVGAVLTAHGITQDDLCNPYLLNYDLQEPPSGAAPRNINCKNPQFYEDARQFMNDTAMTALKTARSTPAYNVHQMTLRNTNSFEMAIKNIVGVNDVQMYAVFEPASSMYILNVLAAYVPSDTARIFLRGEGAGIRGGCPRFFTPSGGGLFGRADSFSFTSINCIRELPQQVAAGYIGNFAFQATVRRKIYLIAEETCTMLGWTDGLEMNELPETGKTDMANCIPCTQMRSLHDDFQNMLQGYGVAGVNHPYYLTMLRSFMNNATRLPYTADQYSRFIESCALADSMKINHYISYGYSLFTTDQTVNEFLAVARSLHGVTIDVPLRFIEDGSVHAFFNFNSVPKNKLRVIRDLLVDQYGGKTDFSYEPDGVSGYVATLFFLPNYGPLELGWDPEDIGYAGLDLSMNKRVDVWDGTAYIPHDKVDISYQGAYPYEVSRGLYNLRKYAFVNGTPGFMIYNRESTINEDYYKPLKQDYLKYVYGLQHLNPNQVLDSIQASRLISRIPSYQHALASYGNPMAPGDIQNLYISDPSEQGPYYSILEHILDQAQQNTNRLFFTGGRTVVLNANMRGYRCSDGSYWYRYFGAGDTLFNVFIKPPVYLSRASLSGYHVTSVSLSPGNSSTRNFKLTITNGTTTVTLDGFTSFSLAATDVLKDAILANPVTSPIPTADTMNNCERRRLHAAINEGKIRYRIYFDSMRNSLRQSFYAYVMESMREKLFLGYQDQRFNQTLYNYDQAGNLIMTVPPEGTNPLHPSRLAAVDSIRNVNGVPGSLQIPQHSKTTRYEYNSMNVLTSQVTPDGGTVDYFVDHLGRTIFSQNEKQRPDGKYTYSLYDKQGRMIETGQVKLGCPWFATIHGYTYNGNACHYSIANQIFDGYNYENDTERVPIIRVDGYFFTPHPPQVRTPGKFTQEELTSFVRGRPREDVVLTTYDTVIANLAILPGMSRQENLRKRVSATRFFTFLTPADAAGNSYDHATHYSYDIAGNVKTLTQDYPALAGVNQRYKRVDYDYDLLSGKINMLSYNRGFADQFYQQYRYDADNRITMVQSSQDGYIWQRDAAYEYYKHGPLARTSLGELRVQGVDYAYTIQGWLKAINGDVLDPSKDMGGDNGQGNVIGVNDLVATSLNYFKGDYRPIGNRQVTYMDGVDKNLYNGNITNQSTALAPFPTLKATYQYDQLNRISQAGYATLNPANNTLVPTGQYASSYQYDGDGNITSLLRNGGSGGGIGGLVATMDSLIYYYNGIGNQLTNITDDAANNTAFGNNDIPQMGDPDRIRYEYDAIGNLVKDGVNGQDVIRWNLYNKVVETRNNIGYNSLHFSYDAAGQRVSKLFRKGVGGNRTERGEYYVRDAGGNILAVYGRNRTYNISAPGWLEAVNAGIIRQVGLRAFIGDFLLPEYGGGGYVAESVDQYVGTHGAVVLRPASWYLDNHSGLTTMLMGTGISYLPAMGAWSVQHQISLTGHGLRQMASDNGMDHFSSALSNAFTAMPDRNLRLHALHLFNFPDHEVLTSIGDGYGVKDTVLPDDWTWLSAIDSAAGVVDARNIAYKNLLEQGASHYPGALDTYLEALATDSLLLSDTSAGGIALKNLMQTAMVYHSEPSKVNMFLRTWSGTAALVDQVIPLPERSSVNYYADPGGFVEGLVQANGTGFLDTIIGGDPEFDMVAYGLKADGRLTLSTSVGQIAEQAANLGSVLKDDRFYLSEHALYGSSRLGLRVYLPAQYSYFRQYDPVTGAVTSADTSSLVVRRPWYSGEYGESIKSTATEPWGQGENSFYVMEHTIGAGKYEIANHLGNVLGVISDKRVERDTDNNDSVDTYRAAMRAGYDYYPFGMLMPNRYTQDTGGRCVTLTQTLLLPKIIGGQISWNPGHVTGGGVVTGLPGLVTRVVGSLPGDGIQQSVTLNDSGFSRINLSVGMVEAGTWRASVAEQDGIGNEVELSSVEITHPGGYNLSFTATGTEVVLRVVRNGSGLATVDLTGTDNITYIYQPTNVVRVVCDDKPDAYRFGFNGQQKDNEIAGTGNSLDFGARMYDSRIARWTSLDMLKHKYPDVSAYSYGLNSPIRYKDEGGKWITDKDGKPIYTAGNAQYQLSDQYPDYYFIFVPRTYYTNDGQPVYAEVYLGRVSNANAALVEQGKARLVDVYESAPEEYTYDCHGNSLFPDERIYIPSAVKKTNDNIDKVFKNVKEFEYVASEEKATKGDFKLFADKDGFTSHSATRDADGTYTSKDDRAPIRHGVRLKQMEGDDPTKGQWGKAQPGYYRHKGNVNGGVTSDDGLVTEDQAQQAIQNASKKLPTQ